MKKVIFMSVLAAATIAFAQAPAVPQTPQAPAVPSEAAKAMNDSKAAVKKAGEKAIVSINSASVEDLAKLPGIGPEKAKAIVAARPFKSIDDLKKVKGIKEAVFGKIKGLVSL